jgi:predicted CXXCH cytochrome family protein
MFAAGVTCSDCHDPHSGKTRLSGDNLCLQCHAADTFATSAHNGHAGGAPPPACASCHMPVRTYMVVDPRHDHSFRVPRPDLSAQIGVPNACNDCHKDRSAEWAAAAIARWHGPERKGGLQSYGPAFHASWTGRPDAATLLAAIAADSRIPGFARAGALADLNAHLSPETATIARAALNDPDPMVRIGALDMLEGAPAQDIWPLAAPALSDPVRGVRLRAVSLLAELPASQQPAQDRDRFERATQEFIAAQRLNSDRPEGRTMLGSFFARQGRLAEAEAEYLAALRLSRHYVPAAVNLGDLYGQQRQDAKGETILRRAIEASPREAALHHALGLALVRAKRAEEALDELRIASELQPERARYGYVYGVALHSAGRHADAIGALTRNAERHPADRDTLLALVNYTREAGDRESALGYAERLAAAFPRDPAIQQLLRAMRAAPGR